MSSVPYINSSVLLSLLTSTITGLLSFPVCCNTGNVSENLIDISSTILSICVFIANGWNCEIQGLNYLQYKNLRIAALNEQEHCRYLIPMQELQVRLRLGFINYD